MATNLIDGSTTDEQTSVDFNNTGTTRFTISGYASDKASWYVILQKKASDNTWIDVKVINNVDAVITFNHVGTFRVLKPEGFTCVVDRD
jgi:hypothetical protein